MSISSASFPRTLNGFVEILANSSQDLSRITDGSDFLLNEEVIQILKENLREYLSNPFIYSPQEENIVGFFDKFHLSQNGFVIVRADLHGDPRGVFEILQKAQKDGVLDRDFHITAQYRGRVKFVFLGDYIDRGEYNIASLCMVLEFKCLNPDSVVLIRGNHEETGTIMKLSMNPSHPFFSRCIEDSRDEELKTLIHRFYSSLSLGCVIIQEGREAVLGFFHAMVDPTINFEEFIHNESPRKYVFRHFNERLYEPFIETLYVLLPLQKYFWKQPSDEEIGEIHFTEEDIQALRHASIDPDWAKSVIRVHNLFYKIISSLKPDDSFEWENITVEEFLTRRNNIKESAANRSDGDGIDYVSYDIVRDALKFSVLYREDVSRLLHMHCFFGHRHRLHQEVLGGFNFYDLPCSFHARVPEIRKRLPYPDVSLRISNGNVELFTLDQFNLGFPQIQQLDSPILNQARKNSPILSVIELINNFFQRISRG